MIEAELRREYVACCTAEIKDVRLFIRNIATIEIENRVIKAGVKGQADAWGWLFRTPYPVPLEIELKNVKTPQNPYQEAWAAYCQAKNVPYILLRARKGETPPEIIARWVRETNEWLEGLRRLG